MGNKQSTVDYSLEKFLSDINIKELHNILDSDLKMKLELLLQLFKNNNNYFENYKKEENSIRVLNNQKSKNEKDIIDDYDDNIDKEITEEDRKTKRFCNLITFLPKLSFKIEFQENYTLIIEIMNYLIREKEFLKFFLTNSSEHLCNMITTNLNYNKNFYQKAITLLIDIIAVFTMDKKSIFSNLSGLRKIIIVPKKLLDPVYSKEFEIRFNLIKLMRNNLLLLKTLYDEAVKDKSLTKNKDALDFVQNTITEFYNTSVFLKLSEDLTTKENNVEVQKMIVECFNFLSQIDFVISDQYLRCEKEVRNIIHISDKSKDDEVIEESLKFLINFHINSFTHECDSNFQLFNYEDSDLEEKLFHIFENQNSSEHIKFLICVLFLTVSIKENIWVKLKNLNMIRPTIRYMLIFIQKTFHQNFYKENDDNTNKRLQKINLLVKIFSFMSEEKSYKKINHIDFFKLYFDIVILLFHVYHSNFRLEVLNIMNVFTYYYECKKKMLEENNKNLILILHKRLDELFLNLKKLYQMYSDLIEDKNKFLYKKDDVDIIEIKNKYQENITLLEDLSLNTKNVFFKTSQEFGLLFSIFVNLMLNHDYSGYINKLVTDKSFFKEKLENIKTTIIKNETVESLKKTKDRGGRLVQYEEFFKSVTLFKNDFRNLSGPYGNINKYIQQITLARLINFPIGKMEIEYNKENQEGQNEEEVLSLDLNSLYEMMKSYLNDPDILHKIIYAINRSLQFIRKLRTSLEVIRKIIEEIKNILYNNNVSSIIVNRECLRFLCTCTMYSDNTLLWLKFDSRKVHVDFSNQTDVLLQYKDTDTDWYPDDEEKERIIFPPYLKVKSYADKMGVIFYGEHVITLPKRLKLGNNFSIWFRFYNPVINTEKWHVLLQDPSGIGGLICIDSTRRRMGLFTEDGKFVDSGIDLNEPELKKKWIQVAMCYKGGVDDRSEQSRIDWYVNGQMRKSFSNNKSVIPKFIQYVGNSRDYSEPFGVFCDVRIYRNYLQNNNITFIYLTEESKRNEKSENDLMNYIYYKALDQIILNFLKSDDSSEETFYFSIKLFNNLMANRLHRNKFINYDLIMKINNYFGSRITETKKDVAKFLQTIS